MAALPAVSRATSGRLQWRGGTAAEGWGRRLRRRLVEAGPIAARFGIYLGSRVDLFSGTDCIELLEIPDRAPASPAARVAELVERQLGARPQELFEQFEAEPVDSGLLLQWHRARLPGGETVTVELVHPELVHDLDDGGLRRLTERLVSGGMLPLAARAAAGEFERQADLLQTCAALEQLAEETADSRWVEVPRIHRRLCSRRIRVFAEPGGRPAELAADDRADRSTRQARARRLARSWLAMALGGDLFPAEPGGRNVRYLPSGRVVFLGGAVHRLPRASQPELREYLAAVAAKSPARAALAYLDLLRGDGPADRRLRDRLRHTDPFRDRGWDVGGDLFARQVLAHWRTASDLGHHLPEGLQPFYRGLFLLNQEVRRLAADAASVRDGLREARLLLLFGELREEAETGRWAGAVERQLSLIGGLPQKLDRILTLAAEDDFAEGSAGRGGGDRKSRRRSAWGAIGACLLAMTAMALLTHHIAEAVAWSAWVERLGALALLLVGALLLRSATGDGGG